MAFSEGTGHGAPYPAAPVACARVLVVDDDPRYLHSLSALVDAHGYAVRGARTVASAAELVRTWHPAVILLDVHLGGGDGFALLEDLPGILAPAPAPPVVVVSGDTRFDTAVRALRHGAADFLAKPCRPEALLAVLARLLEPGAVPSRAVPRPREGRGTALGLERRTQHR